MSSTLKTAAAALSTFLWIATALPAQEVAAPEPSASGNAEAAQGAPAAHGYSKVRIVRISETKGAENGGVQLDRNTGRGFEDAITNLPIVEGCSLRTGTGVAEVEFEDNSTLRLAPGTLVKFTQLELLPSGGKLSTVNVARGMVYASLAPTRGNEFTLTFGQQKLQLEPSSHVRLNVEQTKAVLGVFDGTVQVESPAGTTEVGRKKTLTIPLDGQSQPVVARNVKPEDFDSWDHDSAEYHHQFASMSAVANSPYSYGVSDLMYYGSFINAGGCGQMWQPYFVSAAWSPFTNGTWAWYPGAGYSWVSPYPWGWMPFHYGSWAFCQGTGWGWQPGGQWSGLTNAATVVSPRSPTFRGPHPPLETPLEGGSTMVRVNVKPLPASALLSSEKFVFRNDSAGLGVPRGSLGRLDRFSERAARRGSASTAVYSDHPMAEAGGGQPRNAGPASAGMMAAAPTLHRGYAPPSEPMGPSLPAGMTSGANSSMGGGSSARVATGGGRPR